VFSWKNPAECELFRPNNTNLWYDGEKRMREVAAMAKTEGQKFKSLLVAKYLMENCDEDSPVVTNCLRGQVFHPTMLDEPVFCLLDGQSFDVFRVCDFYPFHSKQPPFLSTRKSSVIS